MSAALLERGQAKLTATELFPRTFSCLFSFPQISGVLIYFYLSVTLSTNLFVPI